MSSEIYSETTSSPSQYDHICRRFTLAEITTATDNFSEEHVVGRGGFGRVYKAVIDSSVNVAIKRLDTGSKQGEAEFRAEIDMLSKLRHCHLVSLIGYCDHDAEMILVYDYMPNGTLDDHLHNSQSTPLSWVQRLKVCIGAARGLDYLHTGTGTQHGVIHRDVKSSNILLDENWAAKVSDFGLSKIGPANQPSTYVNTVVKGTFGYLDPVYFCSGRLTRKSDVYAFGVVIFEVISGRRAVDTSLDDEQWGLAGWAQECIKEKKLNQIVDFRLKGQISVKCLKQISQIAERCVHTHSKQRPTMAEVVVGIELALRLQERSNNTTQPEGIVSLTWKLQKVFFGSNEVNSVHKNAKQSIKNQIHAQSVHDSVLPIKDGDAIQEELPNEKVARPSLVVFRFADLKTATRNFGEEMILGMGCFGTVFLGWIEQETFSPSYHGVGMAIAVKKLEKGGFEGFEEWKTETDILRQLAHPNLMNLLGYCREDEELLLVYEYMENGSLEGCITRNHKLSRKALPWEARLKIMTGIARGLNFLHKLEHPVVHRDVQISNIMIDGDFNAKLGDFGIAKIMPANGDSQISTRVMGRYGYAAPEYVATGVLTVKCDVYSFGLVLLETFTGLRTVDQTRPRMEISLVDTARPLLVSKKRLQRIMDPSLKIDCPPNLAFKYAALVLECIHPKPKLRPSMEQVLGTLEQIHAEYRIIKVIDNLQLKVSNFLAQQ